ncbi:oxygenase MpaB family protein [Actinoplanes rectilineatus]|uniref:oxygenase MpaB family protein n=1 Tax=Actinoplanes rectilineatus TaxID=113571 RepID=UPI000A60E48F|nr:oxygenase MpaB family protein [Actinoplanes rectilineatus]
MVNRAHGRYAITNDDMLYVLSTFVYDPIDWLDRFGWRPLHPHERVAAFHYYREVGSRMGIHDIPDTYQAFRNFKVDYEKANFVYTEDNRVVGTYTIDLFASWFPGFLRPAARLGVRSLLDERMLRAFGFDAAPRWLTVAAEAALKARARIVRHFPPRTRSVLAQQSRNRTYPGYPRGYSPADLGAPPPPPDLPGEFRHARNRPAGNGYHPDHE